MKTLTYMTPGMFKNHGVVITQDTSFVVVRCVSGVRKDELGIVLAKTGYAIRIGTAEVVRYANRFFTNKMRAKVVMAAMQ